MVERDDATGLGFGGNKLRKLDYVLHEALFARRRYDRLGRRRAIEQPAAGRGRGGKARPRLPSCRLSRPARAADAGIQDLGQRVSQSAVRRSSFMTCRGPVTAMQPFARSSAISKRRVTSRISCPTESRMRSAPSLMPRRLPRSSRRRRDRASRQPRSFTAPEAPARTAGLVVGAAMRAMPGTMNCRASISMREPRGSRPMCTGLLRAQRRIPALAQSSTSRTVEVVAGHAGPAYGCPHEATIEAIRLAGRNGGACARPRLLGQGARRPDCNDPPEALRNDEDAHLPAHRAVRTRRSPIEDAASALVSSSATRRA